MITTSARVISSGNGIAHVESTMESGCGGCKSRSSCGVSGLGKYFSGNRKTIAVKCDASVRAGDELQLTMSEGDLLKAGLLAYFLPSLLALVVAGIAVSSGWGDTGAVLGAGVGFALGFLLARLSGWVPRMTVKNKN
ncbi:MAG: SoxR reducing system RseC family protein [Gallionellaceae bacterium]|jgi:sigma-E factor negative regulatory protein RseC